MPRLHFDMWRRKSSGFPTFREHLVANLDEVFRRRVDVFGPEFDLEGAPASVLELKDRVDLAVRILLVKEELRPKRFRVDAQIVLAKDFEKEPKRLEINARSSFLIAGFGE